MARAIVNGIEREVPPLRFEPQSPLTRNPRTPRVWPRWMNARVVTAWSLVLGQIPIVLIDVTNQFTIVCAVLTVFFAFVVTEQSR